MNLTDTQIATLHQHVAEGAQLNDLQKVIQNDFKKHITYMETRFLISDLGITLKSTSQDSSDTDQSITPDQELNQTPETESSGVSIIVDQVTRPGAALNGKVTWSDGEQSEWIIDTMGQLSLDSPNTEYRPSPEDITEFQTQLQAQIGR